jgi:hypothetical protein
LDEWRTEKLSEKLKTYSLAKSRNLFSAFLFCAQSEMIENDQEEIDDLIEYERFSSWENGK